MLVEAEEMMGVDLGEMNLLTILPTTLLTALLTTTMAEVVGDLQPMLEERCSLDICPMGQHILSLSMTS